MEICPEITSTCLISNYKCSETFHNICATNPKDCCQNQKIHNLKNELTKCSAFAQHQHGMHSCNSAQHSFSRWASVSAISIEGRLGPWQFAAWLSMPSCPYFLGRLLCWLLRFDQLYWNTRSLLVGSSFAPFGHSGCVTHAVDLWYFFSFPRYGRPGF